MLIFSQHANTSPYILREVERAVSHNIPLIPFRIEDIPADASLGYSWAPSTGSTPTSRRWSSIWVTSPSACGW